MLGRSAAKSCGEVQHAAPARRRYLPCWSAGRSGHRGPGSSESAGWILLPQVACLSRSTLTDAGASQAWKPPGLDRAHEADQQAGSPGSSCCRPKTSMDTKTSVGTMLARRLSRY